MKNIEGQQKPKETLINIEDKRSEIISKHNFGVQNSIMTSQSSSLSKQTALYSNDGLSFVNMSKQAMNLNKRKKILHEVSGMAKPGQLMAIMGASGCGKTSLLNIFG